MFAFNYIFRFHLSSAPWIIIFGYAALPYYITQADFDYILHSCVICFPVYINNYGVLNDLVRLNIYIAC